jgi:CheY-like chemotaxis protein
MKSLPQIPQLEGFLIIVEDDAEDRALLRQVFAELDSAEDVILLSDSDQLMDLLESIPSKNQLPSLIVLDYNMPALSGESTLLILKEDDRFKHIPVSIYSSTMNKRRELFFRCWVLLIAGKSQCHLMV